MDKQEIKTTKSQWPVILTESEEGNLEAICPFFPNCKAEGKTEKEVLKDIESKIKSKIIDTGWIN
jgi:predicted RNase H-like HicB family nuclease